MLQLATEKETYFSALRLLEEQRAEAEPSWLRQLRADAAARVNALDFPTTRHEEWKYTNLAPLLKVPFRPVFEADGQGINAQSIDPLTFAESRRSQLVFINGLYSRALSHLSEFSQGVIVGNLSDVATTHAHLIEPHLSAYADYRTEVFSALNTAFIRDGAFVYIPNGKVVETPIHLLFISTAQSSPTMSHPRTLIIAGRGAMATIIESYVALTDETYFTNAVTEVVADEGAVLDHYRLQAESEAAFHIGTTQIHQERESNYSSCAIAVGGQIARHNLNVRLNDENTETTINGLYVVTGHQHVDNHTALDHQHPHGTSHQLYKGILDGHARAVFNGKVFVHEGALLTDARQTNKNLLLSNEATVDTKPQLEIFADDVKCAHGATVGQLEDDELFYLASRGLKPETARALLTFGFAEDVISKIKVASVRRALDQLVLTRLHQNLEVQ